MSQERTYMIGSEVVCSDGPWGESSRVVIDPVTWTVTHLVIEPHHRHALARVAPIALVAASDGRRIELRCRRDRLADLEEAAAVDFLPFDPWMSTGVGGDALLGGAPYGPTVLVRDLVPDGETAICRGEAVHAADGMIGRVRGVAVDAADEHVSHLLLAVGRLWTAKEVAVPVGPQDRLADDGPHTALTRREIHDLAAR
ncbi:MAG TPA: hypothetical protein VI318_03465 [Baekduia sp.]